MLEFSPIHRLYGSLTSFQVICFLEPNNIINEVVLTTEMATPGSPNIFFTFGPSQSFVAYIPGIYQASTNFSPEITAILDPENVKFLNFVAFPNTPTTGQVTDAYIGYHKKHGFKTAGVLFTPSPPSNLTIFEEWIKSLEKKTEGVKVVSNSNGIWASVECKKAVKWLPYNLPLEARQWLKKTGTQEHGLCPTCVALGKGDTYVIVWEDGHVVWDLKGLYNSLDQRLTRTLSTSTKLSYLSLDPYAEESYFCMFDDFSCAFQFPETEDFKALEKLILDRDPMRVIIDSPTLRQSSEVVKAEDEKNMDSKGKDGMVKTGLEKAAEDVAEERLEDLLDSL
jgi:hypothetical protein